MKDDDQKKPFKMMRRFAGVTPSVDGIDEKWLDVVGEIYTIFCKKNADYGPNNIAFTGEVGVVVRMFDKMMRIKNLLLDNAKAGTAVDDESVEDTIIDIIDYGIILLLVRRGLWPEYEEPNFSDLWEDYDEFRKLFPEHSDE